MLTIDGSEGEGGGQVLRSALALSILTQQPLRVENIRAKREKPGLRAQHLTAVAAAAEICDADVTGARLASRTLTFQPRALRAGDYRFDIGTAGSTTLVLQTVLPCLMTAPARSTLSIIGGTHNPRAPSVDFLTLSFLPLLARFGPCVELRLEQFGFYPVGQGKIFVTIEPANLSADFSLLERGPLQSHSALALVVNLPDTIGRRELDIVRSLLGWPADQLHLRHETGGHSRGNALILALQYEQICEVVTGFGVRGLPAEKVAAEACAEVESYLSQPAPVGEHLADQLLLPLALAGGGSFVTGHISSHAATNMQIIERFLPIRFAHSRTAEEQIEIRVDSKS